MSVVTSSQMYWLTRCDYLGECLRSFGGFTFSVAAVAFLLAGVAWMVSQFSGNGTFDIFSGKSDEELREIHEQYRRRAKILAIAFVVSALLTHAFEIARSLVPTTKEMAAILVVPRIANSQTVGDLAGGVVALAREWMQELRPKAREGGHEPADAAPENPGKAKRPL